VDHKTNINLLHHSYKKVTNKVENHKSSQNRHKISIMENDLKNNKKDSEWMSNGTSAQLGYTVPFTLNVLKIRIKNIENIN